VSEEKHVNARSSVPSCVVHRSFVVHARTQARILTAAPALVRLARRGNERSSVWLALAVVIGELATCQHHKNEVKAREMEMTAEQFETLQMYNQMKKEKVQEPDTDQQVCECLCVGVGVGKCGGVTCVACVDGWYVDSGVFVSVWAVNRVSCLCASVWMVFGDGCAGGVGACVCVCRRCLLCVCLNVVCVDQAPHTTNANQRSNQSCFVKEQSDVTLDNN
jgi:hypothetical protein